MILIGWLYIHTIDSSIRIWNCFPWAVICTCFASFAVSLRNCCELLEFASVYNASQLRASCQQFICQNLAPLLEGRCLDVLSEEPMQELTDYYRKMVSERYLEEGIKIMNTICCWYGISAMSRWHRPFPWMKARENTLQIVFPMQWSQRSYTTRTKGILFDWGPSPFYWMWRLQRVFCNR